MAIHYQAWLQCYLEHLETDHLEQEQAGFELRTVWWKLPSLIDDVSAAKAKLFFISYQ